MAGSRDLVSVGAATFSIGDYVTAKGAPTLVDMGYIGGPITLVPNIEDHLVEPQQTNAPIRAIRTKLSMDIKVPLMESDAEKVRILLRQPIGNISGTGQNKTLLVDPNSAEQYHAAAVTGKGPGTTGVRTWSFHRVYAKGLEAIPLQKDDEQMYIGTFGVLYEETGTGNDDLFKQVDA